jgi:hypothetical protein
MRAWMGTVITPRGGRRRTGLFGLRTVRTEHSASAGVPAAGRAGGHLRPRDGVGGRTARTLSKRPPPRRLRPRAALHGRPASPFAPAGRPAPRYAGSGFVIGTRTRDGQHGTRTHRGGPPPTSWFTFPRGPRAVAPRGRARPRTTTRDLALSSPSDPPAADPSRRGSLDGGARPRWSERSDNRPSATRRGRASHHDRRPHVCCTAARKACWWRTTASPSTASSQDRLRRGARADTGGR